MVARLLTEVDERYNVAAALTRFGEVFDRWPEAKATVVEPTTLASFAGSQRPTCRWRLARCL
jgi:hypothetical protein